MDILGLKPAEAAIYRNIGGRINTVATLILLPIVTKAVGPEMGRGWNLIILHHTDCGIVGCYKSAPDLLATLDTMAVRIPAKQLLWMSPLTRPTRMFQGDS